MSDNILGKEEEIVKMLKLVFDPEIPVNIYDLGLIYEVEAKGNVAEIEMTLTAPACPAADFIMSDVEEKVKEVEGIDMVVVNLVFDPPWDKDMMSEEAKLELGFF